MADFEKKVALIEIEVDNAAAISAVDKHTKSIIEQQDAIKDNNDAVKALNKANQELEKQVKDGTKTQEEATAEIIENNKKVETLKKANFGLKDEIKDLNKERASAVKATKLQSNSLDALRKKVADQKKELNGLNTATEEGRKRFDELTAELEKNNSQITELDQSAGDYKTTIGQYANELGGAIGGTQVFGTTLGGVFDMVKANPIIFLVSALAGLVAMFKETQSGAEFFRKTGAAVNTIFGVMSDVVEALGNKIIKAFTDPKQALIDIKNSIEENVVFYFSEFIPNAIDKVIDGFGLLGEAAKKIFEGDFTGALETAGEAALKLGDGITDLNPVTAAMKSTFAAAVPFIADMAAEMERTSTAAFNLEQQLIANEKAIADQDVVVAQSILAQKKLNLTIEDTNKTFAERIKAGEEFARVEEEQINKSLKLAQDRLNILKAQNDLTNSTEEDIQRVRDAEINLANLQAASFERSLTNQNKLNSIRTAQQAETEKNEQELNARLLALAEAKRSRENEILLAQAQDKENFFAISRSIAEENFNKELARIEAENQTLRDNEAINEEERRVRLEENQLATEELRLQHKDIMLALEQQQTDEQAELVEQRQGVIREITQRGMAAVQDVIQIANNLVERRFRRRFAELEKMHEKGAITDEEFARRSERLERRKALEAYEIQKRAFFVNQGIALAETGINTATGIMAAFRDLPVPAAIAMAAVIGALGTVQTLAIATQQPPQPPTFAEGGDVFGMTVGGKLHSQGGTKYMGEDGNAFEVEKGEGIFVTKRSATNPALRMLNEANTMNGGRSMFSSSHRFLQDGGQATQNGNADQMRQMFQELAASLPAPVLQVQSVMAGINADVEATEIGIV
jgi:hypothetical protein